MPRQNLAGDVALNFAQTDVFRVADYKPFQALDGEGLRCSLYVSYCPFVCPGCYNKAAQKKGYGSEYTPELEERIVRDVSRSGVAGLTLLGGEPFLSAKYLLPLVRRVKEVGKTVWVYSGYLYEQLLQFSDERAELLTLTDVLVDGPYIEAERDPANPPVFAGSSNQRIIDVPRSLHTGEIALYSVSYARDKGNESSRSAG